MPKNNNAILDSWPELKDDLVLFLSDTDAWTITRLKEAHAAKDWTRVKRIIDVMDLLHDVSHSH
jgi:hypothetical protein